MGQELLGHTDVKTTMISTTCSIDADVERAAPRTGFDDAP